MATRAAPPTERTKVRRLSERGRYDRDTVNAILDEGLVCHMGFAVDGRPWVIPTTYARVDDRVYMHGAPANFALKTMTSGIEACVTVTLLDGLVLARSAFHHSVNYRSVVLYGQAQLITEPDAKERALEAFTDRLVAGRWAEVRWPTRKELKATSVLVLPIDEASAKIRTGPPIDDEPDYALDVWAGVVPLTLTRGEPVQDRP